VLRALGTVTTRTTHTKGNPHHVGAFDPKGLSSDGGLIEAALQGGQLDALIALGEALQCCFGLVAHGSPGTTAMPAVAADAAGKARAKAERKSGFFY
jgi:hypothetical protein